MRVRNCCLDVQVPSSCDLCDFVPVNCWLARMSLAAGASGALFVLIDSVTDLHDVAVELRESDFEGNSQGTRCCLPYARYIPGAVVHLPARRARLPLLPLQVVYVSS